MLFKTGIALLIAWVLGVIGLYSVGKIVHLLLLTSLLLLLLALAKGHDAAAARDRSERDV